ncbi:MAG TPA: hypothetical protein VNL16_15220 [Chloroflexota bacterium]|nr:hypothetical protein [Chloroflexota bacterium]
MARPSSHLIVSTGLATLQWIRTGRLLPTVAPLLTGFLIDADHLVDLARYELNGRKNERQAFVPLHGWEYLPVLFLVERLLGRRFAGGLAMGYLGHLVLDQLVNHTTHPLTYFVSFRWRHGFPSHLFAHQDESKIDWMQRPVFQLWKDF